MNVKLSIKKEVFNPTYFPYLRRYDNRTEVYYGGAGSGKSVFVAQKLIVKSLLGDRKTLVVRKTLNSLRDSSWALILSQLEKFKIKPYCEINKTNFQITLPNGSQFLFKGLDDSEKIKSITDITDIWVEEATEITETDFDQLSLRLRADKPNLQIFLSFNPVSKANWCYKRFFLSPTDAFILKTTYKDNKFLPDDYVKSLEEMINTNPTYYRIYALGEFCSLSRLVFNNWKVEDFSVEEKKGLELIIGLDFGFVSDPSALVASYVDKEKKEIFIFKTWLAKGKTNPEIAAAVKSLGFAKSTIIADSAEQKSIEELKREGLIRIRPSRKGKDSIISGIKALSEYKIFILPSLTDIITEFENYSWNKTKSGEYEEKPIDEFNHCLDALRYSLQCLSVKAQILDRNALGL